MKQTTNELSREEAELVAGEVDEPEVRMIRERLRIEVGQLVVAHVQGVKVCLVPGVGKEVATIRAHPVPRQVKFLQSGNVIECSVLDSDDRVPRQVENFENRQIEESLLTDFSESISGYVNFVEELIGENAETDFRDPIVTQVNADQVLQSDERFRAEFRDPILLEDKDVDVAQFLECAVDPDQVVPLQVEVLENREIDFGDLGDDVVAQVEVLEVGFGSGEGFAANRHDLISVQVQDLQT